MPSDTTATMTADKALTTVCSNLRLPHERIYSTVVDALQYFYALVVQLVMRGSVGTVGRRFEAHREISFRHVLRFHFETASLWSFRFGVYRNGTHVQYHLDNDGNSR